MRLAAAAALVAALAAPAGAACRQALALALDVSGSVDGTEYGLQMAGLASALLDPDVQEAVFALPEVPVAIGIFEWSGSAYQSQVLSWTVMETPEDLTAAAERLAGWHRRAAPAETGLGAALTHAVEFLSRAPVCWRRTLDISGDGKNNDWPVPEEVLASGVLGGVTINALVIGSLHPQDERVILSGVDDLADYFRDRIIQGPDAFVEVAFEYEDYAEAMRRKLLRELSVAAIGQVPPPPPLTGTYVDLDGPGR